MSFASSVCCVNILQQQREQNVQYKTQCHLADKQYQKPENCTVVENGRVVVKPLQPSSDETEATEST